MRFADKLNGSIMIHEFRLGGILLLSAFCAMAETSTIQPVKQATLHSTLANLPLVFEPNRGQADPQVTFLARGGGYTLFLTRREAVVAVSGSAPIRIRPSCAQEPQAIDGLEPTGGISNYFIGNDPARWTTKVPNYRKVRYSGVCPGVDVTYYGNPQKLEYDFTLSAWTDPRTVQVEYEGAKSVSLAANGDLVVKTALGDFVQHKPRAYQMIGGRQVEVEAGYRLAKGNAKGNRVEFALARYSHDQPLVIDPVLVYSTYLGGSGMDSGAAIAVDSSGNAYVTGSTTSTNFPTASPFQAANATNGDAFVTKISADGSTKLYSSYLGGEAADTGAAIAVDANGNAYITGETSSHTFPVVGSIQAFGGFSDAFITKLNSTGSGLVYSTYLGGTALEQGTGIAVDSNGNAYVAGLTGSHNFPTTVGAFQLTNPGIENAFVTKLNAAGSAMVYSTYLGGSSGDQAAAIAVDNTGAAYVTGAMTSANFPKTGGAFQTTLVGATNAFVTKLNPSGNGLVFSTYLGGSLNDRGAGIAVDANLNTYVTGEARSTNFPTMNPLQAAFSGGQSDAFVTKLNPTGTALVYSTYLGGSLTDVGNGIAVDGGGTAYVVGATSSTNFPVQSPLFSTGFVFVSALAPAGNSLLYSTYLSGSNNGDQGLGVALGSAGKAYVTGLTLSANFPTSRALQPTPGGNGDAFVTVIERSHFGDFNGDNSADLIWENDTSRQVTVHYYGGAGGAAFQGWNYLNSAGIPGWTVVAAADFDGNGVPDLVWMNNQTRQVTVHYYGGTGGATFQGWNWLNAGGVPGWTVVGAADFDGNGVPDLIWQNDATRQVTVHYYGGTGGATFQGWNWLNTGGVPGWTIVAAADFDGNGVPDLVWMNNQTRQVTVHYYGGAGGATFQGWNWLNTGGVPGWTVAGANDFDGNGVPDLVWQNDSTRQVTVHYYGGALGATFTGWQFLNSGGVPGWHVVIPR